MAEQRVGYLTLLRDQDGDGNADWVERHAEGFNGPYGLAWRDPDVLVADQDGIWRVPHQVGALRPGRNVEQRAADVPPEQRKPTPRVVGEEHDHQEGRVRHRPGPRQPPSRHRSEDRRLFVGVGSSGNIGVEPEVKATIQRFEADGTGQTTYASGMRNPTALAFQPDTGDLYALVQERDGLGDRLVPDFMTRVEKGGVLRLALFLYRPQPAAGLRHDAARQGAGRDRARPPVPGALLPARPRLLYGQQFPAEYRGDAFVALKGSWNRSEPTGYKVVRVPFKDGRPQGFYENFMTGFWVRRQPRRGLGPPGGAGHRQGWLAAGRRRYRRHHLAHLLHGRKRAAGRPAGSTGAAPPR